MLGVAGSKVWPVSNLTRQLPTTCNMVCKRTQHVTFNIVGGFWPTMLRPFARLPRVSGRFEFRFKELSSTHIDDKFTLFSVISAPGNTNISCLVHSYFCNKYIQYKIIQLWNYLNLQYQYKFVTETRWTTQRQVQILILPESVIKQKGNTNEAAFPLPHILKAYEKYNYWLNIELTLNLVLLESTLTICSAVITSHGLWFSFGPQMHQRRSPSNCDRQATLCSIVLSQIIESVLNEWFLRNQCGIYLFAVQQSNTVNLFSNWNRSSITNLKRPSRRVWSDDHVTYI